MRRWAPWLPRRCARNGLESHDEQYVIGHQTAGRPDLNRKEISGGHHVPVRFQERRPRGAFLSLRCRFYAVPFQDILDRVRGEFVIIT